MIVFIEVFIMVVMGLRLWRKTLIRIYGLIVGIFNVLGFIGLAVAAGSNALTTGITFVMPICIITLPNVTLCTIMPIFIFTSLINLNSILFMC